MVRPPKSAEEGVRSHRLQVLVTPALLALLRAVQEREGLTSLADAVDYCVRDVAQR